MKLIEAEKWYMCNGLNANLELVNDGLSVRALIEAFESGYTQGVISEIERMKEADKVSQ